MLADQVRTITKNGWFSDLEILELWQQINRQIHQQTLIEALNIEKPETPNQTMTHAPQTHKCKQWPKRKKNRNQDWKTVKSETEKVNYLLTNIPTNVITELNVLIYAGANLVCEKIGGSLKTIERESKPGWETRLESQINRLWLQARILKRNIKKFSDETKSTATRIQKKLEENNQKY